MLRRMIAIFFIFSIAGCATIEGAGEDLESAGEAIQEEAEENNE